MKYDEGKPKLTLCPTEIITAVAMVREYGAKKYGDSDSWKDVEPQRYRAVSYTHLYGDSGYLGAGNREDAIVRNKSGRKIKYKINRRPSQLKKLSKSGQYAAKKAEHAKSSVRAKVEHVFGVVKKQLQFRKTRYRGLEKQRAKFNIMFALANLLLADRPCLAA